MTLKMNGSFKVPGGRFKAGDYVAPITGPTDPDFANVSLLVQASGTVGSTSFSDASNNNLTIVNHGSTAISDVQSKFNGKSIYFNGTSNALTTPHTSENDFLASTPWTIEFWHYPIAGRYASAIGDYDGTASAMTMVDVSFSNQAQKFIPSSSASREWAISTALPTQNVWQHYALVSTGTEKTLYINGTSVGTALNSGAGPTVNGFGHIYIGCGDSVSNDNDPAPTLDYFFNGYIDQYRITNGVARYTADFTPPTEAFPAQ